MLKTAKKWALFTMTAIALATMACAATVYLVDPFEHYRESSILPLYDQESYNNPGIAKHYDYDAVILGTSMVEMSNPSVIDECFGVSSVKLPMRGSFTSQMGWQLEHVLAYQPNLKLAILAVDAYSLVGEVDNRDEIVDYLWNDDPLDDVNYLLNRDVLLVRVPKILGNIGKDASGKRDDMYKWTDVVFGEESVLRSVAFQPKKKMEDPDYRLALSTENIERHIRAHALAHPETTFKIYLPPYSAAYWYSVTRMGISEHQYRTRVLLCETLLDLENVEIYDYSSRIEWIEDLDEYFDYSHHSEALSDRIMRAMAAGENRVTSAEEMEAGNDRLRGAAQRFADRYESAHLQQN